MIELRELSLNDGKEILHMIREMGPGENGFVNAEHDMKASSFEKYLNENLSMARGENLKPGHVPQTKYWLIVDGRPVGIGKLRDCLTEALRKSGGHIGYAIIPSERGKGYGTIILQELLMKAKEKGIKEVLVTCNEDNIPSRRVIEGNGGMLEDTCEGKCRYWIKVE